MAKLAWMEAGLRRAFCTKDSKCDSLATWISTRINYDGEARCAKHGPKPPAKRKAFKRWTVRTDSPFRGSLDYDGDQVGYLRLSNATNKSVVSAMNAARVTLPTGRRAKP